VILFPSPRPRDGWAGWRSRYSDWLRAGQSGDRIPVGARFSAPVQTGPGVHPALCTVGTGSFPGGKGWPGRDADPSQVVRPVQSLSACTRVHFTFVRMALGPTQTPVE